MNDEHAALVLEAAAAARMAADYATEAAALIDEATDVQSWRKVLVQAYALALVESANNAAGSAYQLLTDGSST